MAGEPEPVRLVRLRDPIRGSVSFPVASTEPVEADHPRRVPVGLANNRKGGTDA